MLKWYQEPLIHFLVLSTLIFFLTQSNTFSMIHNNSKEITIKEDEINKLITFWEKKYHATPTQEELDTLLNVYIENEILYIEALAMKLDQNDEGIKKLLIDRLKYIISDPVNIDTISDEALETFFNENKKLFSKHKKTIISFGHIYFNPKEHDNIKEKATVLYAKIKGKDFNATLPNYGDLFYKGSYFSKLTSNALFKIFSHSFTQDLQQLPIKQWSKPIASSYGFHLVYMEEINHIQKTFNDRKEEIKNNYIIHNAKQNYENFFKELRKKYQVHIEPYSLPKEN